MTGWLIFEYAFVIVGGLLLFVAPTRYGIWSKYQVAYQAGFTFFIQHYHVYGVQWVSQWYCDGLVWYDQNSNPVSVAEAARLTRLAREAYQ